MNTPQASVPAPVSVQFYREFSQIVVLPAKVTVDNGQSVQISLNLSTEGTGTGEAKFDACPVVFDSVGPPGVQTRRVDDTAVTLTFQNTTQGQNDIAYSYRLAVLFDGTKYISEDPHIINLGEPPV